MLENAHEFFEKDPLVLVDGVPFFDMDSVMAIDPFKIRKIELLSKRIFLWPTRCGTDVLSYSTYKGDLDGVRLDPVR